MSVFSTVRKYSFLLLMLSVLLIVVLFVSHKPAESRLMVAYSQVNTQNKLVTKKPRSLTVTENVNKTVLENGLTVLTKQVHTAPVVTVQVWYKVGSSNEEPGVNGIVHQLEHMMFKGTRNRPIQFGRLFSALGSDSNAFTSYDQTAYYGTLEREKLKALLVLEADRMQNSLIDAEQLASEKRVVISELNQILGGDTLSSRLGAEVRDRLGLTYGIYSNFQAGKNIGTFLIEMQTSPEDASKAIASTRNLLQQLHTHGVTTQEVETAKRTLISNYTVTLANPQELTKRILMNEVYGLDEMELRSFTQKIQTVNLAQVNLAARELLHPDKIVIVTAGLAVLAHGI